MVELRLGLDSISLPPALAATLEPIVAAAADEAGASSGSSLRAAARAFVARSGAVRGARVLLVVPDRTRALELGSLLDAVGAELAVVGVAATAVRLAIASGSHAAGLDDTSAARLGPWGRHTQVIAHRPEDATAFAGRTAFGTDVFVHPELLAADVVLAVGGTAFHYFAGFGGGPKLLFPGLGARASIAANHRRSLGAWPPGGLAAGVEPGRLDGNPVAEDLAAVAALLPVATHLTIVDDGGAPAVWQTRAEFIAVSERFARPRRRGTARSYDVVVASAGGHPRDLDVVQSHKALFHAALYAKGGAQVVLLAACPEGVGSNALAGWLAIGDPAGREERARAAYDLNAQTAISLAAIAARCRVTWIGAGAPVSLEGLGIARATDALAAIAAALSRAGPEARAAYLPVATDVVPAALDAPPRHPYTADR